jgi:hypothetical protein
MGTKRVPDTKTNWPTDRRSQNNPHLRESLINNYQLYSNHKDITDSQLK